MAFEFNTIIHGLGQGSYPNPPADAFQHFDVLVLCAEEHQPRMPALPPGKFVFKIPLDDDIYNQVPPEAAKIILATAADIATYLRGGRSVVTTCHQGLNRSGLLSGLLLMQVFGMKANDAIALIRRQRHKDALCNPMFVQLLQNVDLYR